MKRSRLVRRTPLARTEWKYVQRARPGWEKAKAAVRARSGGCCEARTPVCTGRHEHTHHVLIRAQGGGDDLANLIGCCASCHGFIHANTGLSYERGWLRRRAA